MLSSAARELTWGLCACSRELTRWRKRAVRMPEGPLRTDALDALLRKRGQSDGAALFSILPRSRNRSYLRLLVAYQVIWDYLDSVNERGAHAGIANGRQLHLALFDALDPDSPKRDYYAYGPWRDDGGYLQALVDTCRHCCKRLPSYDRVRGLVLRDALRAQVLALNHDIDPHRRDRSLRQWADVEFPGGHDANWWELTGAASAGLPTFALLALACDPDPTDQEIEQTHAAYFPWASAVACMLDSYADQAEDAQRGGHSYLEHYPSTEDGIAGTCRLVHHSLCELDVLENSGKHMVILCSMVALYLSKSSARAPEMRAFSDRIARAGGSLSRTLIPVLGLWRAVHRLTSS
jgi:tetraprenyl-beta-curcumene synthase